MKQLDQFTGFCPGFDKIGGEMRFYPFPILLTFKKLCISVIYIVIPSKGTILTLYQNIIPISALIK